MNDDKLEIAVTVNQHKRGHAQPLKYTILSDDEVTFTIEKAYEFLELETFEGEREVRDRHVQFLYDEHVAGRFLWHHVILASALLEKKRYRINGQHTCWMRVNIKDNNALAVREIQYKVDTGEQLRALYSAFDRAAPRTVGHISKVLLMNTEAGEGIPPSMHQKLVAGFRVFQSADWRNTMNPTELVEQIKQLHTNLYGIVGNFIRVHYDEGIFVRRAAVIGACFATFDKAVKASEEFWTPVFNGLNLDNKRDPRYALRQFLNSHGHTHSAKRTRQSATAEESYRVCINCWNHWRSGNEVKVIKTLQSDKDRPKVRA